MAELLVDQVMQKIEQTTGQYYRLVLVVAPEGAGKTVALQKVRESLSAPLINVNLELSRRMLDLTERQRTLQLAQILSEIVRRPAGDLVLLDNIELLFDVQLKQDPLRLLQGLSRNKTIVAAWNGAVTNDQLTYAVAYHPEYRRYPIRDFLVVTPEETR